ncbi:MAG: Yip1 family protein [Sphingorhabdus sp.]
MLNRIINILLKPTSEWQVIANEPSSVGGILGGYAVPFSIIQAITTIIAVGYMGIGAEIMEMSGVSVSLADTAVRALVGFAMGLALLYGLAFIGSMIAPSFNGNADIVQSLKLFTYSSTPSWVAGALLPFFMSSMALMIVVSLLSFASIGYAIYLIYAGAGPVMGIPQEKLAGFTVVVIALYIGLGLIVYGITSALQTMSLF